MTRLPYRRPILCLLFAGGIASILATSRPGYYIGQVTIEPEFRCPDTDVRVDWTRGEAAPVLVSVGGIEILPVDATSVVIPADRFDPDARETALNVTVDHPEAVRSVSKTIRTLQGTEIIDLHSTARDWATPEIAVHVSAATSAVIDGVSVSWPWTTRCETDETERRITWQVSKNGKILATLRPERGYASPLPAAAAADGQWIFHYTEETTGRQCKHGYGDEECLLCRLFTARFRMRCAG